MPNGTSLLLAGDIGGTKTVLALYDTATWPSPAVALRTYPNQGVVSLNLHIAAFLAETGQRADLACFGAAGPVLDDAMQLTNLNWQINANQLKREFGFSSVFLINDLVATALGAVLLPSNSLLALNAPGPKATDTVAIIAPGTGLGEAYLQHDDQDDLHAYPSEGGHAAFAPRNQLQLELCRYLLRRQGHVSTEQVCSGSGFPNLFAFMQSRLPTPSWLTDRLAATDNPGPVVVEAACAARQGGPRCPVAEESVALFVDILAGEAANLALKLLPFGGLYIGGGIPPRILPFLDAARFMSIFCQGIHGLMLRRIPIQVILDSQTALLGAAAHGMAQACQE